MMYLHGSEGECHEPQESLRYMENGKWILILDGGMGTLLAEKGWNPPPCGGK